MSRSLRYQLPAVREHLASHYAIGTQSDRVRRRCERLMKQDPEFEARVYQWQNRMNKISDELEPVAAPNRVWRNVQAQISELSSQPAQRSNFWFSLGFWRSCAALMLVLCVGLLLQPAPQIIQSVNYMAVMQTLPAQSEPAMVITAYKGDAPGRSHLHIQWNERLNQQDLAGLSLWAISRETGEATDLGALSRVQSQRLLSKPEWLAIKDSAELLVVRGNTMDGQVLYRGPCLQLSAWQDAVTPG
ncbi:MAG: hypothetical protein V7707_15225 [Motiliproteus sp.]